MQKETTFFKKMMGKNKVLYTIFNPVHKMVYRKSDFSSKDYWETRYQNEGNSGAGSYGKFAEFKAEFLNSFVKKNNLQSVMEFGCGDGNQTKLFDFPEYIGLDVSGKSIEVCSKIFREDKTKSFFLYDPMCFFDNNKIFNVDLTLSLDVIYHMVEDHVFEKSMHDLFNSSKKYVIIYSSDKEDQKEFQTSHVKHRKFTKWVKENIKGWKLQEKVDNKHPLENDDEFKGSFADFYVYKRV